jgi:hypothetical protein
MDVLNLQYDMDHIQYVKYEWLFRQLSNSGGSGGGGGGWDKTLKTRELRMTLESLKEGMKILYKGQSNDTVAQLIYNYFSKGLQNYAVKFTQFMKDFIRPFQQDHQI